MSVDCPISRHRAPEADLEDGSPWPLADRRFGAVVVTNYLHRPFDAAAPRSGRTGRRAALPDLHGRQRTLRKAQQPRHLLKDGELLDLVRGKFSVIAYEARLMSEPPMAMVQRIAARRL